MTSMDSSEAICITASPNTNMSHRAPGALPHFGFRRDRKRPDCLAKRRLLPREEHCTLNTILAFSGHHAFDSLFGWSLLKVGPTNGRRWKLF
jgi:hypothetical protein